MRIIPWTIAAIAIPIFTAAPAFAAVAIPRVSPVRVNVVVDLTRSSNSQNQGGNTQSSGTTGSQGESGANQNAGTTSGGNNGGAEAGNGGNGGDGGSSSDGGTVRSGNATTNSQSQNTLNTLLIRISVSHS